MTHLPSKNLLALTTEITYRALGTVGPTYGLTDSAAIAAIGEAVAEKIATLVALQEDPCLTYVFQATDVETFQLFCDLFDEIQKEIPVVARLNVTVTDSRLKEIPNHAASATDGDQRGGSQDVDA